MGMMLSVKPNGYLGNEDMDVKAFQDRVSGLNFDKVNQEVADIEGMEKRTEGYLRKLDLSSLVDKFGHLFWKVTEWENGQPDYHFSLDGNVKGSVSKLNTKILIRNDNAIFINGRVMDQPFIEPPKEMSQAEFDELVIQNSQKYDIKVTQNQYLLLGFVGGLDARNSNTYVDNVIEESGSKIKNFGRLKVPRQNFEGFQKGLINKAVDTKYGTKTLWDKLTSGGRNEDALEMQQNQEKSGALRKDREFKD